MAKALADRPLKYRKRASQYVVAVRLDLERVAFSYTKWGGEQRAKRGDWLVDNDGDVYTVDASTFARTYRKIGAGRYVKATLIWARVAREPGRVKTQEGSTGYKKGDYLVSNERSGADAYAISMRKFRATYLRARD